MKGFILAIYHFSVKTIGRNQGRSATGAAAYRAGEKIADERSGLVHDYTRKNGIDHTEILAPEFAPDWVYDRSILWNIVELCEKRKDARLCREIDVALPVELTPEQSRDLVKEFVQDQFVKNGMVSDLAIHHAKGENPHAHILLTTRNITPDGFGQKNTDWNKKEHLSSWRVSWQDHANKALERSGHEARIDHRTLKAQGIERVPQIHVGPNVFEMEQRGIKTERGQRAFEIEKANEKIQQLQNEKEALEHEQDIKTETGKDHARAGERDRTAGPSTRDSDRQNERATASTNASVGTAKRDSATNYTGEQHSREHTQLFTASNDHTELYDEHPRDAGAYDRILDLARPTDRSEGRYNRGGAPDKPLDRTYLAVRRQLKALNCDRYEVGVRNSKGKMLIRTWSDDEVLKSVSWLKRENAKGADIYVRPAGDKNQGIVLVDDLSFGSLERMKSKGFEPAAVVETSPQNFQAWVRLSKTPLDSRLATALSRGIANHFEADLNSADWRHFGRLAGFTNQKPEHKKAQGRTPWVLCHESSGQQASIGDRYVQTITQQVIEAQAVKEKETRLRSAYKVPQGTNKHNPIRTYQSNLKALTERYGADLDLSRADFMICSNMAMQGFSKKQLIETLEKASPELPKRKAGHELDYCQRTVEAVYSNPKVKEHINARQRETGLSR